MHMSTTSPIAYSGGIFNNETKLELLLQNNKKHGNPLHAIAEERYHTLEKKQSNKLYQLQY